MGLTPIKDSDRGRRVLGKGQSPSGRSLNGKGGVVIGDENHYGEDVVSVRWDGEREVDEVRQSNVSGTGPTDETLPRYQRRRR